MTASSGTAANGRGRWLAILVVVGLVAAAIGAYLDWLWWVQTQGIVITLAAIAAILLAGLLFLLRRSLATRLAFIGLAIGIGLLVGQWLGPSREPLILESGRMALHLTGPVQGDASAPANCQMVASGDELQVSMDPNARLEIEGVPPEEYPIVTATFAYGDRWQPQEGARQDGLVVSIYLNAAMEPADGGPTELWLESSPESTLQVGELGDVGTLQFAGLVVASGEVQAILGTDGDVTGTLEWGCG